jgi:hypothetical protein
MAELALARAFRLPIEGWPKAVVRSDYAYGQAQLWLGERLVARADDRRALESGIHARLEGGVDVTLALVERAGRPSLALSVDGKPALSEDDLRAPPSRSALMHALIALAGSAAGFAAGWLYHGKAVALASPWALKMAYHTAGWHLLLTLTLFPASLWGQRPGIRAVQFVSAVFFCIHLGIAIANLVDADSLHDGAIGWLNALSGVLFLASVLYGQVAHRDMDPVAALLRGRL